MPVAPLEMEKRTQKDYFGIVGHRAENKSGG